MLDQFIVLRRPLEPAEEATVRARIAAGEPMTDSHFYHNWYYPAQKHGVATGELLFVDPAEPDITKASLFHRCINQAGTLLSLNPAVAHLAGMCRKLMALAQDFNSDQPECEPDMSVVDEAESVLAQYGPSPPPETQAPGPGQPTANPKVQHAALSALIGQGLCTLRELLVDDNPCVVAVHEWCGDVCVLATLEFGPLIDHPGNPQATFDALTVGTKCCQVYLDHGFAKAAYIGHQDGWRLCISGWSELQPIQTKE